MGDMTQNMKIRPTKICEGCGKVTVKYRISPINWAIKKFCSMSCKVKSTLYRARQKESHLGQIAWNKGKSGLQVAWNKGNSEYAKKLGFGKWMLGKRQSIDTRKKKSEAAKRVISEGRHNFYIDGRNPINHKIRNSLEYKLWRESVFKRDNYTCQHCGIRSGQGVKVYLQADHIKPFAYFPKLRFELTNGRSLCIDCHKKTDTYMGRALNYFASP